MKKAPSSRQIKKFSNSELRRFNNLLSRLTLRPVIRLTSQGDRVFFCSRSITSKEVHQDEELKQVLQCLGMCREKETGDYSIELRLLLSGPVTLEDLAFASDLKAIVWMPYLRDMEYFIGTKKINSEEKMLIAEQTQRFSSPICVFTRGTL